MARGLGGGGERVVKGLVRVPRVAPFASPLHLPLRPMVAGCFASRFVLGWYSRRLTWFRLGLCACVCVGCPYTQAVHERLKSRKALFAALQPYVEPCGALWGRGGVWGGNNAVPCAVVPPVCVRAIVP